MYAIRSYYDRLAQGERHAVRGDLQLVLLVRQHDLLRLPDAQLLDGGRLVEESEHDARQEEKHDAEKRENSNADGAVLEQS